VRLFVFVVAVVATWGCDAFDDATPSAPAPRPAAAAAPTRAQAAAAVEKAAQDCRDTCEQTNILAGGGDDALRACRERCDARFAPPPHEVPSRISVARPAHAPPLVKPLRR